ncbi:MAG: VWA domain-containing protein [Gammaproteobacteria bacterium]|nr:VWA domain-containing protein [Gammaproteobacteria bacterium]
MSRRARREAQPVSLSFLDVITCGFGAIILLLTISRIGTTIVLERSETPRSGIIRELQEQLFQLRGEVTVLLRDIDEQQAQLAARAVRVEDLRATLAGLRNRAEEAAVRSNIEGELRLAMQTLTEEMQRLLAERDSVDNDLVGGIPVDSEYIIFIIDTSGSMVEMSWRTALRQINAVLDTYPRVKGLQIMNDEGRYMFPETRGQWLDDSAARRRTISTRMPTWQPYSNSSPVEGIIEAIRTYYSPERKISLYVFGDDFAGSSYKKVLDAVETVNPKNERGETVVRIHGIGFPGLFDAPGQSAGGWRYATLMRELARRNGGAFVGLESSQ